MKNPEAYISIELNLADPIEISDFAALFAGFGAEFDRHLQREHPDLVGSARMYVREVRKGSVIADLFASIPDMIDLMDAAIIVLTFGAIFNQRIRDLIMGKRVVGASKLELRDLTRALKAVAEDKDGTLAVKGFRYREGAFHKEFEAAFTTKEARLAITTIERQKDDLDKTENVDHQRVLMVFTRSDVGDVKVGKFSGERVCIEEISGKSLALVYGSDLSEQKIKYEIREADENVFKKGFLVDVNVKKMATGRPAAYSVTALHDVIDLPDEGDE